VWRSARGSAGEAAPPLVLTTIDGGTFDLGTLHGKVVLVNYWATWCAPCRKEMPKLDALYRKYHSQGLEMVGISIDFDRDLAKARKVASSVSYPTDIAMGNSQMIICFTSFLPAISNSLRRAPSQGRQGAQYSSTLRPFCLLWSSVVYRRP
jgi:thiol-disulfide isomerase/thioredoxin